MEDSIVIHDLRLNLHIGAEAPERESLQLVVLDIEMCLPLSKAGRSRALSDSIDYAAAAALVKLAAESKEWVLLEELSERLAAELLRAYEKLTKVRIEARKFALQDTAWTAVRIVRMPGSLETAPR